MVRGSGGDGVRHPAGGANLIQRLLPAGFDADPELRFDKLHVGAHDPGQQDIADPVVKRVRPVDPAFLYQHGLEAQTCRDRGNLPGVVGLHPADRDQRVRSLRQRVWHEVLQLANLVATVGEPGIAVLPFRPDRCSQMLRQPIQRMQRARAEHQRITREIIQRHPASSRRTGAHMKDGSKIRVSSAVARAGALDQMFLSVAVIFTSLGRRPMCHRREG